MRIRAVVAACIGAVGAFAITFGAPAIASAAPGNVSSVCASAPTSVAVVVDFGDRGAGGPVNATCVPADSTDSGADVLAASHQVRFDPNSGLVCAIDGYPASGCGDQSGSTYAYWSYWHGTGGGWQYSNIGPAGTRVKSTVTEGWRFNPNGGGNPSDPAPRGDANPAATCQPPPTAPPAQASPTTAVTASPAGSPPPASSDVVTTDSTAAASSSSSDDATSTTATSSDTGPGTAAAVRVNDDPVDSQHTSGSSSVPMAVAGGAIALLGVGGVLMARRRNAPSP